ncbi:MAG: hypothetical protein RR472_08875, partial [Anaerovoracaceae bacterium]
EPTITEDLQIAANERLTVPEGSTGSFEGKVNNQGIVMVSGKLNAVEANWVNAENGWVYEQAKDGITGLGIDQYTVYGAEQIPCGDLFVEGGVYGTDYQYYPTADTLRIKTDTKLKIKNQNPKESATTPMEIAKNITANLTLNGVNITAKESALLLEEKATLTLTLEEGSINTLRSGKEKAGLQVTKGTSLVITKESKGSLTAVGGANAAGIGGGKNPLGAAYGGKEAGTITIEGGSITAYGGEHSAGIGGGYQGDGGTTIISGGTITASSGANGAGIGGGFQSDGGSTTISGGKVNASGGANSAGIGGGYQGQGGTTTISGGTVEAQGGDSAAGIGGGSTRGGGTTTISGGTVFAEGGTNGAGIGRGYKGFGGTFATTDEGNAFIRASRISDQSNKANWSGIIFEENQGTVYKDQTISGEFVLGAGETLSIPKAAALSSNGTI